MTWSVPPLVEVCSFFDDYSPLRHITAETFKQKAQLFPVKDARMYIQASLIGSQKGSLGDAFFTAPNPPYGATFTYYLKESLRSKKQQRRAEERKLAAEGKPVTYPDWETLREEDVSEKPAIVLVVKDAEGQVVRRLTGPTAAGFHRVQWDFRYPAYTTGRWGRGSGPMAVPGEYSVSLHQYVDGEWTELAAPKTFQTKSMGLATLEAKDKAAVFAFQQKVGKLQRALFGTNTYLESQLEELARIKSTLMGGNENPDLLSQSRAIERKLQDMQLVLQGDQTRASRAEFTAPGLMGRLQRVVYGQNHSAMPTKTHQDNYQIALDGFEELYRQLKGLVDRDLAKLHKDLEANGVPWTPGQGLPTWR
jgi:hypothetical protein